MECPYKKDNLCLLKGVNCINKEQCDLDSYCEKLELKSLENKANFLYNTNFGNTDRIFYGAILIIVVALVIYIIL